jgi:hypothetical protein
MTRFLSLMFAMSLVTPCETAVRTGLERPYAFRETPISPLSSAFEQDTRAYVKRDRYELSLDLWSLMIGVDF